MKVSHYLPAALSQTKPEIIKEMNCYSYLFQRCCGICCSSSARSCTGWLYFWHIVQYANTCFRDGTKTDRLARFYGKFLIRVQPTDGDPAGRSKAIIARNNLAETTQSMPYSICVHPEAGQIGCLGYLRKKKVLPG